MALGHLNQRDGADRRDLYRIFVYDCPPLSKKAQFPVSRKPVDFSRSDTAQFRSKFHDELKCLRKVALRLGRLQDMKNWRLRAPVLHSLLRKERTFESLTDSDFVYDVRQKGTDMKIGLDIASVAYKKQADQMVLVAGDSDFVPAAKLARREGVDFILDPMWGPIADDLHEHIDGLRSTCPRPVATPAEAAWITAPPRNELPGLQMEVGRDVRDAQGNGVGRRLTARQQEHYNIALWLDKERPGCKFTREKYVERYQKEYPGRPVGSILPADFSEPSSESTMNHPKFMNIERKDGGKELYVFMGVVRWLT